jgi:hypothetical protein
VQLSLISGLHELFVHVVHVESCMRGAWGRALGGNRSGGVTHLEVRQPSAVVALNIGAAKAQLVTPSTALSAHCKKVHACQISIATSLRYIFNSTASNNKLDVSAGAGSGQQRQQAGTARGPRP